MKMRSILLSLLFAAAAESSLVSCTGPSNNSPSSDPTKASAAATLPNDAYLRKLSFHLKGENPSTDEYEQLASAEKKGTATAFVEQKISDYLKSPQFIAKMELRINDLMRVRSPDIIPHWPRHAFAPEVGTFTTETDLERNAFAHVIEDVVGRNQPWDDLLLSKKFRLYNFKKFPSQNFGIFFDDPGFFSQVYAGPIPPSRNFLSGKHALDLESEFVDIEFPADFSQAAGLITTPRFFDRYVTTEINKNRRRAAAIYRIFLCDDMVPVAGGKANDPTEVLKIVFPTKDRSSVLTPVDAHGSDAACMKCHTKLDPVGAVFSTSALFLSLRPSVGALNTEKLDGTKTSTPYRGFDGLARALVTQEKYSACQVQHFSSWFIGDDRPLDANRQRELMTTFDDVNRRTGDFITQLVRSAEFREPSAPDRAETLPELQALVQPILKRCDTCHASHPEENLPTLADDLIGGSPQSHLRNVNRIATQLDLENGGVSAKMPPTEARWLLSRDEKSLIYRWVGKIRAGTQAEGGRP